MRHIGVDLHKTSFTACFLEEVEGQDEQRFLKLGCLPAVVVPSADVRELRHLLQAREELVKMATQLKNVGHAALTRNGIARGRAAFASGPGRRRLAALEGLARGDRLILDLVLRQLEADGEVAELERAIVRAGRHLPGLRRLLQVRGLSLPAAIGMLAEIGDIERFPSAKQLAAYAGLVASVRQSGGTERRGGITKEGRHRLRAGLRGFAIQAVLSMVRDGYRGDRTPLVEFSRRTQREKGSGKAICATARKLLTIIHVLLTKGLDYWYLEERLYQRKLRSLDGAAAGEGGPPLERPVRSRAKRLNVPPSPPPTTAAA